MDKLLESMEADMSKLYDCIIIGGGIFGCSCALELSKLGKEIIILDKNKDLMLGASSNNTNRLHLGYHYPRDLDTALQCKEGFEVFAKEYSDCILKDINNIYCISSYGSNVTPEKYKQFCKDAGLPFEELSNNEIPERLENVDCIINTKELIYDCKELKNKIKNNLKSCKINTLTQSKVIKVEELDNKFKVQIDNKELFSKTIINSTYANYNTFHQYLNLPRSIYQFELTYVPIIRWRSGKPPIGITVMDGNFFSVLPHGKTGDYTLYHVYYSVLNRVINEKPPSEWENPYEIIDGSQPKLIFKKMINSISEWLPSIKEAEFVGYLSTTRMVLSKSEKTDARPTLVEKMPTRNCFYSLFSGKIDHSILVSRRLAANINKKLQ